MPQEETRVGTFGGVQYYTGAAGPSAVVRFVSGLVFVLVVMAVSLWIAMNPEWVLRFGHWGYLGAFLIALVSSATIVLPAPGFALLIAMATALDPLLVAIVAAMGSALGELTGYVAGATGAALVPAERRAQFERIHFVTGKYGAIAVLALATIPFPFFDLVGIIAGMIRMSVTLFLGTVFIGNSVKYAVLIWLGVGPLNVLLHFLSSLLPGR